MESTSAPIYWARVEAAPTYDSKQRIQRRFRVHEFNTAAKRDQFVKNTKFEVKETGQR